MNKFFVLFHRNKRWKVVFHSLICLFIYSIIYQFVHSFMFYYKYCCCCALLLRIPRTPHFVKIYCLAFEVKNQSFAEEPIAMRLSCTIPLHCPQSGKLKIRLLRMLLDSLWGMSFSSCTSRMPSPTGYYFRVLANHLHTHFP